MNTAQRLVFGLTAAGRCRGKRRAWANCSRSGWKAGCNMEMKMGLKSGFERNNAQRPRRNAGFDEIARRRYAGAKPRDVRCGVPCWFGFSPCHQNGWSFALRQNPLCKTLDAALQNN